MILLENIMYVLSDMIGEGVYATEDCMSGIFQLELNPDMGLNCRIDGVAKDESEPGRPKSIVMVDQFKYRFSQDKRKILWYRALAAMAIYRVKVCYWVAGVPTSRDPNWEAEVIKFEFDENEWSKVYEELKEWSLEVLP